MNLTKDKRTNLRLFMSPYGVLKTPSIYSILLWTSRMVLVDTKEGLCPLVQRT